MTKEISPQLLEILVCPLCKGELTYDKKNNELICYQSKLAYPVIEGVANMIIEEARKI